MFDKKLNLEDSLRALKDNEQIHLTYKHMNDSELINRCFDKVLGIVHQFDEIARRYNPQNYIFSNFYKYIQSYSKGGRNGQT